MPFTMKIQPIDIDAQPPREQIRPDLAKPVLKSRLKRLFDRPFTGVLRSSTAEKPSVVAGEAQYGRDGAVAGEFEPSSICLAKMVQSFIEESNERQSAAKCGRNRCNCFNGNNSDSSDDELDLFGGFADSFSGGSSGECPDLLKSLIPCASVTERNLLADTAKIVEKNKTVKRKDDLRKIVTDGLSNLGYDSSICKSKWEKSASFPAGEYDYIDVIVDGERLLIDVDFRSEFEIARPTGTFKAILQSLPFIFVGRADRLGQIVAIVADAAKQSLKKKGMHFPPWRKAEYMRAKWLSPSSRASQNGATIPPPSSPDQNEAGELALIFGEKSTPPEAEPSTWQAPETGAKVVTGLASLFKDKP